MTDRKRKQDQKGRNNGKKKKVIFSDSEESSDEEYDPSKDESFQQILDYLQNGDDEIEENQNSKMFLLPINLNFDMQKGQGQGEEEEDDPREKYLKSLTKTKRKKLEKLEEELLKLNTHDIPLRFKILNMNASKGLKSMLLQKVIQFEQLMPMQSEYFKIKKYMDGVMKLPLGKLKQLPVTKKDNPSKIVSFMQNLKNNLDKCIYGQNVAKENIMQVMAKWITNPESTGNVIGLCGPPGVGKTSIIKNGLSKALDLPFGFITLGGSTYASSLEGFEYTYEGSKWGRIVDILMEHQCMNPVIFFDELDKISDSKGGDEITSILIHLTDPTQNNSFNDKYFNGIDIDLSKTFIIFSFNDINRINPILRDRIKIIQMDGFKAQEKLNIARDFSLEKICKNVGMKKDNIIIPEETLRVIISTYCNEKGVRKLEKCLETLIMKLNLFDLTKDIKNLSMTGDIELTEPYHIDPITAVKLLDPVYRKDEMPIAVKMMYS